MKQIKTYRTILAEQTGIPEEKMNLEGQNLFSAAEKAAKIYAGQLTCSNCKLCIYEKEDMCFWNCQKCFYGSSFEVDITKLP